MKFASSVVLPTYPCLEIGNLSYPDGGYEAAVQRIADSGGDEGPSAGSDAALASLAVSVEHQLSNAPFIEWALQEKLAQYACLVSVPVVSYRKVHISEDAKQTIVCESRFLGETPYVQPMIVAAREFTHDFGAKDGVDEIFYGSKKFPKGARLARGEYLRPEKPPHQLLNVILDAGIPEGSFKVEAVDESEFYFNILVPNGLYEFLKFEKSKNRGQYRSMITHIVHACFVELVKDYGPESDSGEGAEGKSLDDLPPNLIALVEYMQQMGVRTWLDGGFDPLEAAMKLYPHKPEWDETGE